MKFDRTSAPGHQPEAVNEAEEPVVLLLQVPRTNDKKELAAEQMFASLHGLLLFPSQKLFRAPKRVGISFEIAVLERRIGFYVHVPRYLKDFVEEQIYAQYPMVQISEVEDYSLPDSTITHTSTLGTEMRLTANQALPIKTFQSFEVDPLAAITATLAKFEEGEEAWIQLIIRPAATNWHQKSEKYISGMRGGSKGGTAGLFSALWKPPEHTDGPAAKLTEYDQARAKGAEDKSHKLAFETTLRIVYRGNVSSSQASLRLQSIVASYKQFNTTYMNGFEQSRASTDPALLDRYTARQMASHPLLLNIEEVATLYHLPHTTVETPFILWASSQTAEPPANLPILTEANRDTISPIAVANFRGHNTAFGMPRSDRGRHLYIIGQTGVGKSGLLELLTISDISSPYGFAVIDPHGDYALSVLRRIPPERAHDVIYFNPADTDYPIAFNPMEVNDPKLRSHTASELIGVLKRMFESWGPRLEYILRYSLLALLEYPEATMLDITRILTDKKFRTEVLQYVSDPVVRNFWTVEFTSWNDKFAAEAVAPVLNKVGAFTANPLVRNIIGQPKSSFNIRQIMDERKILIVNLSRGLVGEDNAALLGALLVTKMQLAAMSRADMPAEERTPFYLYVDEFQNFATDSFATILSEARKYALNLTVANQYIAQMSQEVKDAVFGNVGSMIAFRMGADDARGMQRYFEPKFEEYDLVHMHNRHFVINMTIEGEKSPAFSAISLDLPPQQGDNTAMIIESSRAQYALHHGSVEQYIDERHNFKAPVAARTAEAKPAAAQPAADPAPAKPPRAAKTIDKAALTSTVGRTAVNASNQSTPSQEAAKPAKRKRRRRVRKNRTPSLDENAESVLFSRDKS
ncbi:MAG TPA: type IV secretion system DNA-binding domain-containing protein [Candidatus Saccharimonadales bacterium]